ncbi:sigma factor-like helix-turn-helix DNA-binding protein [Nonomuraea sp. NPDC049152]|uniref:sigma factor-like helix-turn-helix DNA-binding protein n=1 Tax=Nonomuraea sp. NPDC049152 TaxID=3154350 RepID=UPI003405F78F
MTGYDRIAQVCGVPVGTVRSRLSQARAKLAGALEATAAAHSDARLRTAASWDEARGTLSAAEAGDFDKVFKEGWSAESEAGTHPNVALAYIDAPDSDPSRAGQRFWSVTADHD